MAMSEGSSLLKGRWTIWIIALVFSLLAGFGVLTIIGSAAEQRTYYVLAQDVPARTPITPDNVLPLTTNADGYPPTALSLEQLQMTPQYSLTALRAGDVVTTSVVGPLQPITDQVPSDFVAVSLAVTPENAVGGRIRAGDLVDIAAVAESAETGGRMARVVLTGVRVLDVSVSPSSIAQAAGQGPVGEGGAVAPGTGPDSWPARDGIPQLYTFAVSPDEFAVLALLRDKNVYLALTNDVASDPLAPPTAFEIDLFGPVNTPPIVVPDPDNGETPNTDDTDVSGEITWEEFWEQPVDPAVPAEPVVP